MAKTRNGTSSTHDTPGSAAASPSPWTNAIIVTSLVALVLFGYLAWAEMRGIRRLLDARLDQIDVRMTELSTKIEKAGNRPTVAQSSGPDPNRVYSIKTDGSPSKGPLAAPVTIAEFSDFQ